VVTVRCVGNDGVVFQFTQVTGTRVPVWASAIDARKYSLHPPFAAFDLLLQGLLDRIPSFRAVSYDRLPVILSTGIDVEPTDAPPAA